MKYKQNMRRIKSKLLCLLILAVSFTLLMSEIALAGQIYVPSNNEIQNIDLTRLSNLTITKSHPNPYNDLKPGEKTPEPVYGVRISVSKIKNIDLSTKQGWNKIKTITVDKARNQIEFSLEQETDNTGKTYFNDLPVGLYLIEELKRQDSPEKYKIEPTTPILISIPSKATKVYGKDSKLKWAYTLNVTLKPKGKPLPNTSIIPNPIGKVTLRKIKFAMTGADIIGFTLFGLALTGIGIAFVIVASRKNSKEEEE